MALTSMRSRLLKIEKRLKSFSELTVVRVEGGLPDVEFEEAHAGAHRWQQEAEETLRAFRVRATQHAMRFGHKLLIIGGLPDARPPSEHPSA